MQLTFLLLAGTYSTQLGSPGIWFSLPGSTWQRLFPKHPRAIWIKHSCSVSWFHGIWIFCEAKLIFPRGNNIERLQNNTSHHRDPGRQPTFSGWAHGANKYSRWIKFSQGGASLGKLSLGLWRAKLRKYISGHKGYPVAEPWYPALTTRKYLRPAVPLINNDV